MATDDAPPSAADVRQVLLGVRLVGFGPDHEVARRARIEPDDVVRVLGWAERSGFVNSRAAGAFPGWSLTAEGRRHGGSLLAEELAAAGTAPVVREAYRGFLELNQPFLDLCTAWQLKTAPGNRFVPNEHDDDLYDRDVIERLVGIHADVQPVLVALGAALARFGGYRGRLRRALELVEGGDGDWFTRPIVDSYHTVWFELHEDLLATLGLDRTAEH